MCVKDIDQQITQLFEQKIERLYQAAKDSLLAPDNYTAEKGEAINTDTMKSFISFLEGALSKPIDRFSVLCAFVQDEDSNLLTNQMYPLRLIKPDVIEILRQYHKSAVRLIVSLEVSGIPPSPNLLSS